MVRSLKVRDALSRGRQTVAEALATGATHGPAPGEETLSWLLQSEAASHTDLITVRAFTRHEESRFTGADWLWWWEGDPNEWFGCLVQAKRLIAGADGPTFDFDYRTVPSAANPDPPFQVHRLLDASDALNVPAAYMLYRSPAFGSPGAWSCATIVPDLNSAAATFVAAAVVNEWLSLDQAANLRATRPVECFTCEGSCGADPGHLAWYASSLADPAVREMLAAPPSTAARRAFRALFSNVVQLRALQLRGPTPDVADRMHSGFRLGEHFARGVRTPPAYVRSILNGQDVQATRELQRVAGVVVILDH